MEDLVSWFCAVKKMNFENAFWRSRDHGPFSKTTSSAVSVYSFCKGFENRLACFVLQQLSSCKVWKLFNNNQHERVTVIAHFRIWQINQISLPLIINAADDSATTSEITTNKPMQRAPWFTVRWWRVRITLSISKPVTFRSVVFEKFRQSQSGVVKLSTYATANILKKAVTPTCH